MRSILQKYAPQFDAYAFGSRVTGKAKANSDLDIALLHQSDEALPAELLWNLRDAFSESDLPILVDIVDFEKASPEFQRIMQEHWILI